MTTIWMDPDDMAATGQVLVDQTIRVRDALTGVDCVCGCELPRSLVGWIDEELVAITEAALRAATGYLTECIAMLGDAEQIKADQSLVAAGAQPGAGVVGTAALLPTVAVVGGSSGPDFTGPTLTSLGMNVATVGGTPNYAAGAGGALMGMGFTPTPSFGPSFMDVLSMQGDITSTILAPSGLTVKNGDFVDSGGDTATSLVGAYRDPVTGRYDL